MEGVKDGVRALGRNALNIGVAVTAVGAAAGLYLMYRPGTVAAPLSPAGARAQTTGAIATTNAPASEREKIAALLDDLAASKAVFVRNGTAYSGADAADHLRRKLKAAGDGVRTVEEFVEKLATRSSASGEAYLVREGGREQPSGEWFRDRLAVLQRSPSTNEVDGRKAINGHADDGAREVLAFLRAYHERFRIVESDEIEFYSGSALARRIDFKYMLAGRPKLSVDDFIEQFCTSSSVHGTEYQIDREPPKPLGEWLKAGVVR